ncbi:MAG: cellulase family glycosylhydrolase [Acholeplasmatales bacterium]|nr:cellulase family glycosylhydrolase [Acholeplasmatales bacterium]
MKLKKGINLGGWLSQCEPSIEHYETFIVESDFKKIKDKGFDHVRVPVDYNLVEEEDGTYTDGFKYIDRAISWAKKYDLNMILDLHETYGFVFDDETKVAFFNDRSVRERFFKLWEEFSNRYAKYKDMLVFELLNEVTKEEFGPIWNEAIIEAISRIRKIDKDILIIFGGTRNNSITDLVKLPLVNDKNVIYTFHCYEPLIFTHQGAYWIKNMPLDFRIDYPLKKEDVVKAKNGVLKKVYEQWGGEEGFYFGIGEDAYISRNIFEVLLKDTLEFAKKNNLTLYCGEYGVINLADKEAKVRWYEDIHKVLEKYNIGRALWSYKEMDYGVFDPENASVLDKIVENA